MSAEELNSVHSVMNEAIRVKESVNKHKATATVWWGTCAPLASARPFTLSFLLASFHSKSKRCQSCILNMHRSIYRVYMVPIPLQNARVYVSTQNFFCIGISDQENPHQSVITLSKISPSSLIIFDLWSSKLFSLWGFWIGMHCLAVPGIIPPVCCVSTKGEMWFILKEKETAEKSSFQMHCNIHLKTEIIKEEE